MRTTKSISIAMPIGIVKQAERLAKRENRSMSDLFREALRNYETSHKAGRRNRKDEDDLDWVTRIIDEAKKNPMTEEELAAEDKRLAEYGARQAKKLGIKERDVVRIIHESRARRKSS